MTKVEHDMKGKQSKKIMLAMLAALILFSCTDKPGVKIANPMLGGDHVADPSVLKFEDTYYLYATIDPWGADELAVYESADFVNWERKRLNWPTKEQCTSSVSNGNMVWAPSVIQALDGQFYMYVSVGSEVWVGVSTHPLGPWRNAKTDESPLISGNSQPGYHMIDAEAFIDTDGQAYLYWGSGWNWENGHCFVAMLNKDMCSFSGEIHDITPPNYFEAPFLVKRDETYYLMYSDGKCTNASYKVRYAKGNSPFGPWEEGVNSPILSTSADSTTLGPGHHTIYTENEQDFILYHRIHNNQNTLLRETCVGYLKFDDGGEIRKVDLSETVLFKKK